MCWPVSLLKSIFCVQYIIFNVGLESFENRSTNYASLVWNAFWNFRDTRSILNRNYNEIRSVRNSYHASVSNLRASQYLDNDYMPDAVKFNFKFDFDANKRDPILQSKRTRKLGFIIIIIQIVWWLNQIIYIPINGMTTTISAPLIIRNTISLAGNGFL